MRWILHQNACIAKLKTRQMEKRNERFTNEDYVIQYFCKNISPWKGGEECEIWELRLFSSIILFLLFFVQRWLSVTHLALPLVDWVVVKKRLYSGGQLLCAQTYCQDKSRDTSWALGENLHTVLLTIIHLPTLTFVHWEVKIDWEFMEFPRQWIFLDGWMVVLECTFWVFHFLRNENVFFFEECRCLKASHWCHYSNSTGLITDSANTTTHLHTCFNWLLHRSLVSPMWRKCLQGFVSMITPFLLLFPPTPLPLMSKRAEKIDEANNKHRQSAFCKATQFDAACPSHGKVTLGTFRCHAKPFEIATT